MLQNTISSGDFVTINKTFKYRLKPTQEQEILLRQTIGCCRFVYNYGLARWKEQYEAGLKPSVFNLSVELTQFKQIPEYAWLNDVPVQCGVHP